MMGADATAACVVTIDGPAGTGKSSVAQMVAQRLGLRCLDTGSMYRAVALLALESGCDAGDGPALASLATAADLHFDWSRDPAPLFLGDRDVSARIRDLDVSNLVSEVAAQPEVRMVLGEAQRRIARKHPRLITEGRDQGSVVFPDADVRFFLDADETVRAGRRVRQLQDDGATIDAAEVRANIAERDQVDRSRAAAPLVQPEGAIRIDSTELTLEEVVDRMVSIVAAEMDRTGRAVPE